MRVVGSGPHLVCSFVPVTGGQPVSSRGRIDAFFMSRLTPPSKLRDGETSPKILEAVVIDISVTVMVNETRRMVRCVDLTHLKTYESSVCWVNHSLEKLAACVSYSFRMKYEVT